jgi:hypothetical protein
MRKTIIALVAALAIVLGLTVAASPATAAKPNPAPPAISETVTGTFTDAVGGIGTFTGTITLERFTTAGGELFAVVDIVGTLTDSLGNVVGTVDTTLTLPVTASGSCQVLHLELGPLDLDLLGLVVHLDQVVLDITAQSGPGNLLGNLLCAIAGLLDSNVIGSTLANLLNQLLSLFG